MMIKDSNMSTIVKTVAKGVFIIKENLSDEVTIKLTKRKKTENEEESISCIISVEVKD